MLSNLTCYYMCLINKRILSLIIACERPRVGRAEIRSGSERGFPANSDEEEISATKIRYRHTSGGRRPFIIIILSSLS